MFGNTIPSDEYVPTQRYFACYLACSEDAGEWGAISHAEALLTRDMLVQREVH
jgi:hypothetical protein